MTRADGKYHKIFCAKCTRFIGYASNTYTTTYCSDHNPNEGDE